MQLLHAFSLYSFSSSTFPFLYEVAISDKSLPYFSVYISTCPQEDFCYVNPFVSSDLLTPTFV